MTMGLCMRNAEPLFLTAKRWFVVQKTGPFQGGTSVFGADLVHGGV